MQTYTILIPHICHFIYTGILCGWNISNSAEIHEEEAVKKKQKAVGPPMV